jgi:hypothetical protein
MKTKSKSFKLGSIADEAALCRKAFAKVKVGAFTLHCHHEVLGETLTEDAEDRISYILSTKPEHEQALRLRLFRPASQIQLKKFNKAYADRQKAYADWQKAYADWQKAYADRQKAYADRQKAYADRQKAYADWQKADADWQKEDADWQKEDADRQKAYADRQKAYADLAALVHDKVCYSNCPWNGKTIFPKGSK